MKVYDSDLTKTIVLPVVIGVIVTAAVVSGALFYHPSSTTPTTSTTTTPTQPPSGNSVGVLAAKYLNARRNDVVFYWLYNCTFVNEELSSFYQQSEPSAYVDGVYMIKGEDGAVIKLLFAPWYANLIGAATVSNNTWELLSGAIIDDGIRLMADAETHPDDIWEFGLPTLQLEIYFNDGTLFSLGYVEEPGLVQIRNGTWSGDFTDYGWPEITGLSSVSYWLIENGHLQGFRTSLYTTIVEQISYPKV